MTTSTPAGTHPGPAPAAVPLSLPTRALFPSSRAMAATIAVSAVAFTLTAKRPKRLPPRLQLAADATTATIVVAHPLETMLVRRAGAARNVSPAVRRRTTVSTAVFGIFGLVPSLRAFRRGSPQDRP